MNVTTLTALISAASAIAVCLINNHFQRTESDKKHEAAIMLINYQIEELKKAVEKHNSIVERTFALEKKLEVTDTRLEALEKEA
jgi:hypothetical protein